jgi:hypothetical protein
MKFPLTLVSIIAATAGGASAAVINWTMSPATSATEVDNSGTGAWAYMFSTTGGPNVTVNGVTFTRLNTEFGAGGMATANALTPGFTRGGFDSYAEANDEFYLGPDPELNQLMDGLTWGGDTQFQLGSLTPGTPYMVQLFSSDDRASFTNRVLDLDSNWATPDGIRQLENIDYTAGGAWVDPAGRSKIFTGTFVADSTTQDILAVLDNTSGQIDLNAIQLRVVIPEPSGWLLLSLPALGVLLRRRR